MRRSLQRGATIIEFSLALLLFLALLLGLIDFARMLYVWNAADAATQLGARYAIVCDDTGQSPQVLAKMQALVPEIAAIDVTWSPAGCSATTCAGVTVAISDLQFQWISPVAGVAAIGAIPVPAFATYVPREVMRQDPTSNAICN